MQWHGSFLPAFWLRIRSAVTAFVLPGWHLVTAQNSVELHKIAGQNSGHTHVLLKIVLLGGMLGFFR